MIQTSALIAKFQYALDNGWGYIMGAAGVLWTAEKQARATDAMAVKYGSKWIGHYVADCSGLFTWAFSQLGGYMYHGSNTMWNKYCTAKGKLKNGKRDDGQPLRPGTAVFIYREAEDNRSHVGLYIGNGKCIEARGTEYGVVESKIGRWDEWGELKGVSYEEAITVNTLRRGADGPEVKELQEMLIALGYSCGSYGADGKYGGATESAVRAFQRDNHLAEDGVAGPETRKTLQAAYDELLTGGDPGATTGTRYTVSLDGETYQQLLLALQQAKRG